MIYKWKISKYAMDAQAAGEELERIRSKYNSITPEIVVEESRSVDAVLHNCFEWNDAKAAEAYRARQAQALICNIVVENVEDVGVEDSIRAFVHVQKDYKPIETVVRVKDYRQEMLNNALKELKAFKDKYRALSELNEIFSCVDELIHSDLSEGGDKVS